MAVPVANSILKQSTPYSETKPIAQENFKGTNKPHQYDTT